VLDYVLLFMNENNLAHFVLSINHYVNISLAWVLFQYAESGIKQNFQNLRLMITVIITATSSIFIANTKT